MRILIVNKFAHVTGGADRHCLMLAEGLRRRGHAVSMLSTDSADNVQTQGRFVRCTVTNKTRAELPTAARLHVAAAALWNQEAGKAAAALVREWRPDVVHAHKLHPQLSVAPLVSAARLGVPVVQTLHDYEFVSADPLDHRGRRVDTTSTGLDARALNTAALGVRRLVHRRLVRQWISVSEYVRGVHRRRGIDSVVLRHPLEPRPDPRPRKARRGIAFVGRLTPEKGVADLIAAARAAPDLSFSIFGDGPLADEAAAADRELPNLSFGGRLSPERVVDELGRARVAAIPSRWQEPAGLAALEAIAAGTPVVAYGSGGLREYVGPAGVLVSPSADALLRSCRLLHDDEETWERCAGAASNGRSWLPDARQYLERLEDIYEQAIRG
jgi:glycosyltransferase involved in cell wall biosynthesis